jgi:hypothetical protein
VTLIERHEITIERIIARLINTVRDRLIVKNGLSAKTELSTDFSGKCGLAQAMIFHACEEMGLVFRPFAIQTLQNYYFGHVAGTIENCSNIILIDPTFTQFRNKEAILYDSGTDNIPGIVLSKCPQGKKLAEKLYEDGYASLTGQTAKLYLNSFLNGHDCGLNEEEALALLARPPQHDYNLRFGSDNVFGTKNVLADSGYKIEPAFII